MRTFAIGFLLSILSFATSFSAGIISPRLEEALSQARISGRQVTALVVLSEQIDHAALNYDLSARRATIAERAFTVITSLQHLADQTQAPLLTFLQTRSRTEVSRYQSFWVTNMVLVEALPEIISEIALRDDVDVLDLDAELTWDKPVAVTSAPHTTPNGSEPGLRVINANRMWDLGFTGAGRIVMNIDTGVNGNHVAINYKWRGIHVPASQAWFDPVNGSTFPNDCDGHGTHTIGTMTGLDPATNDTVGVAPGAEWIAANSLCTAGAHTSNSIASFQWAMDPDGDPGTIDDMPDAIGNSWFDPSATDCSNGVYRQTFDAVEAAGIAIVFSAGNAGPSPSSITVPKNTNTDEVNVFATGAVDGNNPAYPIASFSSRGPSTCGGFGSLLIKPEASAPGVNVRSSYGISGNGYSFLSGTSMACPHVVGAIALLKEAFPQFTGHDLKMALYNSTTDLGPTGEDNDYGMGLIDVYAAFLNLGVPNPPTDFNAYSDYTTPTTINLTWEDPTNLANGDTLLVGDYTLYLKRDGLLLDSLDGGVEQYIDANLIEGQLYLYEMYSKIDTSTLTSVIASVSWTAGGARQPEPPTDFSINGDEQQMTFFWTNPSRNVDGTPMIDFAGINLYQDGVLTTAFSRTAADTGLADSATHTPAPPGVYRWYMTATDNEVPANESSPTPTLSTPLAVPFADAFPDSGSPNPAFWANVNADINTRSNNPPTGPYALNLNAMPAGGDTIVLQPLDLSAFQGTGIVLSYYWQPQGNGNAPENPDSLKLSFRNDVGEWVLVRAYHGRTLQAFQQEVIVIDSTPSGSGSFFYSQFQLRFTSRGTAGAIPNDDWFLDDLYIGLLTTSAEESSALPIEFSVSPNYPNPFNPTTTISYTLPVSGEVELVVYSLLGAKVRSLVAEKKEAGFHEAKWVGTNDAGIPVTSGVYVYRFSAGDFRVARKMVLMK